MGPAPPQWLAFGRRGRRASSASSPLCLRVWGHPRRVLRSEKLLNVENQLKIGQGRGGGRHEDANDADFPLAWAPPGELESIDFAPPLGFHG